MITLSTIHRTLPLLLLAALAQAQQPIADEAPGAEAAASPTQEMLLEEFARFKQLLAEKAMDEADIAAKRVVEMAIRIHGPRSRETAQALHNLALVQHSNGQFDAAVQNFTSAVEILESVGDRLNEELVNPLRGLGAAQLGTNRPDLAAGTFGRAAHITHVNQGPHNLEQLEILESLAESNVRLGDMEAAEDVLERIYLLNMRHYADDPLGMVPALMQRAGWQRRAGQYNDERVTYRRAIRLIEDELGKDAVQLIPPLRQLGESFYYLDPLRDRYGLPPASTSGEGYLKRAVRIAENTPEYPWYDLATTRLALADYYTYADSQNRSRNIYMEVWESLSADEDRLAARRELLEQPVTLREGALPRFIDGRPNSAPTTTEFLTGTVRIEYTISDRGRVRNIRSKVTPAEFKDMQRTAHREMRHRIFRPQLIEGQPVQSDTRVFEHRFYYQQADLDKARETKAPPKNTNPRTGR